MTIYPKTDRRPVRSAIAAVEFAVVLPVLVTLIFGIWEYGRLVQISQIVANAAREGGRQASTAKYTSAQVTQAVLFYLTSAGVVVTDSSSNTNVTIVISVDGVSNAEVYNATQGTPVEVSVSLPIANMAWLPTTLLLPSGTQVSSSSFFLCMADVPITVPNTIPQQILH
jgi:Flp pilus assembly protein TadG